MVGNYSQSFIFLVYYMLYICDGNLLTKICWKKAKCFFMLHQILNLVVVGDLKSVDLESSVKPSLGSKWQPSCVLKEEARI